MITYSKALKGLSPRRQLTIPLPRLVCSSFVQVSKAFLQEQSQRTASPVSVRRVANLVSMGDLNERDSTGLLQQLGGGGSPHEYISLSNASWGLEFQNTGWVTPAQTHGRTKEKAWMEEKSRHSKFHN